MSENPPDFARAVDLFEAFQKRAPKSGEIVQLGGIQAPVTALAVGAVVDVAYRRLADGKDYRHYFERPLPRLFVSADGKQAFFEGGGYYFSAHGFEK